jgi:three-Cys-motif partner protein
MADNLPTVWPADPHTFAKHAILEYYLKAWFPILTHQSTKVRQGSKEVLFIDGFAGPGEYTNSPHGSPVIALNSVLDHDLLFPIPVHLLFIEQDQKRFDHLVQVLERLSPKIQTSKNSIRISKKCGDCNSILNNLLDAYETRGVRLGPSLAFLDQFGYAAVSMELIKRFVNHPQCEVFSYLDYKDMNRWITDQTKNDSFNRTFGGEEWKKAINLPSNERRTYLLNLYKQSLRTIANIKYVYHFSMFDQFDTLLYWLIFSTNNLKGLEIMKTAMWKVDNTGEFKFSDKDASEQLLLLNKTYDDDWLSDKLCESLAGKELTIFQIREYVLIDTPCYKFKEALKILEKKDKIKVTNTPPKRKRGTYSNDEIRVRFPERNLFY